MPRVNPAKYRSKQKKGNVFMGTNIQLRLMVVV